MSKRSQGRSPYSNGNTNRYLKKKTATNSFNEKFTIYAEMNMQKIKPQRINEPYSYGHTPTQVKIQKNYRYQEENSSDRMEDSQKISILRHNLRSLLPQQQFDESQKIFSSRLEFEASPIIHSQSMNTNPKYHLHNQTSLIRESRLEDIEEDDQTFFRHSIREISKTSQIRYSNNTQAYNRKLQTLKSNLQIISKKQYCRDQLLTTDKYFWKQTEPLKPSSNSVIFEKRQSTNNIKSSNSYALPLKGKLISKQIQGTEKHKQIYNKNISKSISVSDHPKNTFNFKHNENTDVEDTKRKNKQEKQRKNVKHYNFSDYYKKAPYANDKKTTLNKSQESTLKMKIEPKKNERIQAPNLIVKQQFRHKQKQRKKSYPSSINLVSQEKIHNQKQPRAKKSSISVIRDNSQITYHRIEPRIEPRQTIQYFNKNINRSSNQNKSASKQKKSFTKQTKNVIKREFRRLGTISSMNRAQITSIISLSSFNEENRVCYVGSADYGISRVQFNPYELATSKNYQSTITKLYRHRGCVNDMILGSQNRYLMSCGRDSYLKIGVLKQEQIDLFDKCTLYSSFKLDSIPMKLSRISEDIIGVATIQNLSIYDVNKNFITRHIHYPSPTENNQNPHTSKQNSFYGNSLLHNQNYSLLGTKKALYYIDYRCSSAFQRFYTVDNCVVDRWMIDSNCNQHFGYQIQDINKKISIINSNRMQVNLIELYDEEAIDFDWRAGGKEMTILMDTGDIKSWGYNEPHCQKSIQKFKLSTPNTPKIDHLKSLGFYKGYNKLQMDEIGLLYLSNSRGEIIVSK